MRAWREGAQGVRDHHREVSRYREAFSWSMSLPAFRTTPA